MSLSDTLRVFAVVLQCSAASVLDNSFDPLSLKKSANYAKLQVNEIKNGRLAMLAFSGICTQAALTGKGFPYF